MQADDLSKLLDDLTRELRAGARQVGILGMTTVVPAVVETLHAHRAADRLRGIYTPVTDVREVTSGEVPILPVEQLAAAELDVRVVAADGAKEDLLLAALPHIRGVPKMLVAGYGHLAFHDPLYRDELRRLDVPSLANGYPNSLIHLYQCLVNAARLGLNGVVAEFGMFKGGTTMFLSQVIKRLGMSWLVIGFDTFGGFPPRRSPLDMYDHPDCVFTDLAGVRSYLDGRNVEIVVGDIVVEAADRLTDENVVLSFVDTDNYSSARAVLDVVQDRTVVGGAIVFDHFTGVDRFRYTLGERIAGLRLLDNPRYFHLHQTGVFYRQH
jgi:O-methyltransferase